MYTAAVLTPVSRTTLTLILQQSFDYRKQGYETKTPTGGVLPHHMTINMGGFDSALNPKETLGKRCFLEIDSIVRDDVLGVCAARVTKAISSHEDILLHTTNDDKSQKHITLCLKPGVKPVTSNKLFETARETSKTIPLETPFLLEAVLEEV
jgi:hypothetical protein